MLAGSLHFRQLKSAGFSLIEVLVSIVVLTFGLLGMVGMQAASLQANREANLQSSAIILARELSEMIRGNKVIGVLTTANPYLGTFNSPLTTATPSYCLNVGSTACATPTDVANAEMTEWLARVDSLLPGARVISCFDTTPYDAITGLPTWACTNGPNAVIVIKVGWTRSSTNKGNSGAAALDRVGDATSLPSIVLPVTAGV